MVARANQTVQKKRIKQILKIKKNLLYNYMQSVIAITLTIISIILSHSFQKNQKYL